MADVITAEKCIRKAYEYLKEGKPEEGRKHLEEALKINFEHPEVLYALKCLDWWLEKFAALKKHESNYKRGVAILSQWAFYYKFLDKIGSSFESCQYAIQRFVYSAALRALQEVQNDGLLRHDPELLLYLGRCYKGLGEYENAAHYLGEAAKIMREDAAALAEFADVNALLGKIQHAKFLFREAFYFDPQAVDIRAMESGFLQELARFTEEEGKKGEALNEWLPVYGALTRVFSAAHKLKACEVSKLEQSIKTLENDLHSGAKSKESGAKSKSGGAKKKGGAKNESVLLPRLLNCYLRLMKHYEDNNNATGVSEIVLKIRIYDAALYERYLK